jgi:NAD(P)-dependent dehydrogenase (short-subunit alcohol dehydrogenase family)
MIPPHSFCDLAGRVALVTGVSRGIGRAICIKLAKNGARVAVHYNNRATDADDVCAAIADLGGKAIALSAALGTEAACRSLVRTAADELGPISILVNNAALFTGAAIDQLDASVWEETLAVNLSAPFHCARACVPAMRARGWGRIISISSQAAFTGSREHAHYTATKAGLLGLSFSLARELGPDGITVNVVSPGRVETEMLADQLKKRREEWLALTPLGRLGTPDEVAAAVAFLASDEAAYITGANLHVNGGLVMG